MEFSTKHKFLFFAVPKTASTSIRYVLKKYSDRIKFNNFSHLIDYDPLHIDQTVASKIFQESGIHVDKNSLEFIFVRHPFSKLCSQISYANNSRYNTIDYTNIDKVLDVYENNICRNIWLENDRRFYNFCLQSYWAKNHISNNFKVFKVEEIDNSWNIIRAELGLDLPNLPVINKSANVVTLTDRQKARAYDIFKEDFDLFGYDK